LNFPPYIMKMTKYRHVRWAGCVARREEMRNLLDVSVRNCEGKRSFRSPMFRWEDNIKINIKETG
jgi:hypothetical protein